MTAARGIAVGVLLAGGLLAPAPGRAEEVSLRLRGLLDLVLASQNGGRAENAFNHGQTNFDPYHLRLFVEADAGYGFQAFTQSTWSEVAGVQLDGAYVLWTPVSGRDLHLEAGKIPMPVGTFPQRTYSDKNPLIGIPMMYQYHTTLRADAVPPDADALLLAAGTGQQGPDYGPGFGAAWKGMPIVYERCWDFGLVALGSAGGIEYSVGVTQGTPAVPVAGPDSNDGKAALGRLGAAPLPWLRFGVSGAWGSYLPEGLGSSPVWGPLLAGRDVDDFAQKLWMGDLEILVDRIEVRAEAHHNTWETPTVGDLEVQGGYLEAKAGLYPGTYVAGRYEILRFEDLAGATQPEQPWDHDRDRWELGVGYRVTRSATLKAVFQRNLEQIPAGEDVSRDIAALQLSMAF